MKIKKKKKIRDIYLFLLVNRKVKFSKFYYNVLTTPCGSPKSYVGGCIDGWYGPRA
jgi:hypothetical protein